MNKKQLIEDDLKYIWRPFTQMKSLESPDNKPIIIKRGRGIYIEDDIDDPMMPLPVTTVLNDTRKSSRVYLPRGILYPVPALNIPDKDKSSPYPESPGPASRKASHLPFDGSFPK